MTPWVVVQRGRYAYYAAVSITHRYRLPMSRAERHLDLSAPVYRTIGKRYRSLADALSFVEVRNAEYANLAEIERRET